LRQAADLAMAMAKSCWVPMKKKMFIFDSKEKPRHVFVDKTLITEKLICQQLFAEKDT
jgi:hypothetical protein